MKHRWILVTAVALTAMPATPAMAIESGTCRGSSDAHAGRKFWLGTDTSPITGNYTYAWDLDNDGTHELDTGTDGTLEQVREKAGTYTFGVRITDNDVAAGDPKRQASGKCDVTVANDLPTHRFEVHERSPAPYGVVRFTYDGWDLENELNERPLKHAIDFDGDGQFEFTAEGAGEVYASFPPGFDKDVTHRMTDDAGGTVDTRVRVKTADDPFGVGVGDGRVLGPLSDGPFAKVTASAPKSIRRRTLLTKGLVVTFGWGPALGSAEIEPVIGKVTGFTYGGERSYAPGQRLMVQRLSTALQKKIRRGAKKIQLRWVVKGLERSYARTGTLTVKITR